jgi:hypothetical protein
MKEKALFVLVFGAARFLNVSRTYNFYILYLQRKVMNFGLSLKF